MIHIPEDEMKPHAPVAATDTALDPWGDVAQLEVFTAAAFAPHVGEAFALGLGGERVLSAVLLSARPFPGDPARPDAGGDARAPFALLFRGPRAVPLPQGTYRVTHAALGSFPLFLVPVGPDAAGLCYEAVFS